MLYPGGVALAVFLTLLLLSKRNKTIADKILAGWLIAIAVHLLLFYFWKAGLYPQLLGAGLPFPLIHGPFLYLYTLALTKGKVSWVSAITHLLPFSACVIYLIPFFSLPTTEKIYVFQHQGVGYEVFNAVRSIATTSSGILYVTLSTIALRRHRRSILQQFSSTDRINLRWLQYLIYWLAGIWIFVIFGNDDLVYAAAVLFVLFIGFFGIRQVGIFITPTGGNPKDNEQPMLTTETESSGDEISERRKYQKSGLSTAHSEVLHRNLTFVMTTEKPFRESELSLAELARRLNTQPNYLSQVINEREGKNFYDYVNALRIEEFKRLAASPESRKFTLLALAQECGFNSKSSFNRHFKKVTGKSPSEFIDTVPETVN